MRIKKSLTLIEVLVAVAIFSALSVSLYRLLHTGILVRKRITLEQMRFQNIYIRLERIAQEIRNIIIFKNGEAGLEGDESNIEFYTLLFDYQAGYPNVIHISYNFKEGIVSRTTRAPLEEEPLKTFPFFEDVEDIHFYYFDAKKKKWQDVWKEKDNLPQGVKIEFAYRNSRGKIVSLQKHVFIYRKI